MATAAPFYRVPVVIFAVLVGGLYVYAKSGGAIFGSRTQVTPAADAQGDELGAPRIEFMMGPKSAPAFDELPPAPAPQVAVESTGTPMSRPVLGGSKSRAVIEPSDVAPPTNVGPSKPVPTNTNIAPTNAVPQPNQVLPGSKSFVVFPPTKTPPPSPTPSSPPTNAAPIRPRVLPGSKSAILVDPAALTPAPQPAPPTNYAQPRYNGPINRGPSNAVPRNYPPSNAAPQNNAAPRPRALPGSKSMILISPEAIQQATRNSQPANAQQQSQQQLQLPANQVRRPQ